MGFLRRLAQRLSAATADVDRVRLFGTLAILALGAAALWWTSRHAADAPEPQSVAVLTAGPWLASQPAGEWAPVEVPARISGLLAGPEDLDTALAARDLPGGVLVAARDIVAAAAGDGDALVSVAVGMGRWPGDGPRPGDRALLVAAGRTCAETAVDLLDVRGEVVVIAADPQLAGVLALNSWDILKGPPDESSTPQWRCAQPPRADDGEIVVRVPANVSSWPAPGPQPADEAMFVRRGRGCADHIVPLVGIEGDSVAVVAGQGLYAALESGEWLILPAPESQAGRLAWRCPQHADDLE